MADLVSMAHWNTTGLEALHAAQPQHCDVADLLCCQDPSVFRWELQLRQHIGNAAVGVRIGARFLNARLQTASHTCERADLSGCLLHCLLLLLLGILAELQMLDGMVPAAATTATAAAKASTLTPNLQHASATRRC